MPNLEGSSESKGILWRRAEERWAGMRWVVLLICLLGWCVWSVFTYKHWEHISQTSALIADVVLLACFPFPCVLMFLRRDLYSPSATLLTYVMLQLAFGVVSGR